MWERTQLRCIHHCAVAEAAVGRGTNQLHVWVLRGRVSREALAAGKQIIDDRKPPNAGRDHAVTVDIYICIYVYMYTHLNKTTIDKYHAVVLWLHTHLHHVDPTGGIFPCSLVMCSGYSSFVSVEAREREMSTKKTTVRLPAKRSGPDPTQGLTSSVGIRATTNTQKKEENTNNAKELDGCFQLLFGAKNMHTHTRNTHTHPPPLGSKPESRNRGQPL